MAKKRKKASPTKYTTYRTRLQARVRYLSKQGISLMVEIPSTERELRKAGITGKALARKTRELKKLLQQFGQQKATIAETGEIATVKQARKIAKELRETYAIELPEPPEGDTISGGLVAFQHAYEELISKIQEPVSEVSSRNGRTRIRSKDVLHTAERGKTTIMSLLQEQVRLFGVEGVGFRISEHADEIDEMITILQYSAYKGEVEYAISKLGEIIKGNALSYSELSDLNEQAEYNDSYEIV